MARNGISIELIAKTEKAAKGIQDINSKLSDFGKQANDLSNKLRNLVTLGGTVGILTAAVGGLVSQAKALTDTFKVQEQAETRLMATLKATGQYTPRYTREMKSLASAMQGLTTYGDETVLGLQSLYIATKKIGSEMMPRATMAALDMAAALGEDATGAAKRLAKVLADPTTGLDALKDANISLTKAQMEEIAETARQGNLLEAQSKILDAVESAYAGTAKAIAETDTGKLEQIANVWGDIKEGLGSALLDSIGPALDIVLDLLTQVSDTMSDLDEQHKIQVALDTGGSLGEFSADAINAAIRRNLALAARVDLSYVNTNGSGVIGAPMSAAAGQAPGLSFANPAANPYADMAQRLKEELYDRAARAKWGADSSNVETGTGEPGAGSFVVPAEASFLDKYGNLSKAYKAAGFDAAIAMGQEELKTLDEEDAKYKQITESIAELTRQKEALYAVVPEKDPLLEYLEKNSGLSQTSIENAMIADLEEARGLYADISDKSSGQAVILAEIISEKEEELRLAQGIETEEEKNARLQEEKLKLQEAQNREAEKAARLAQQKADEINQQIHMWTNAGTDILNASFDLALQLMDNDLQALEEKLSEAEKLYDDYFDNIESKYDQQKDALDAYYANGEITEEEYQSAKEQMLQDEQAEIDAVTAQREAAAEEVDRQKKRIFDAEKINATSQVAINSALAISDIWANHAGHPMTAGFLTGAALTTMALQTADIWKREYKPMASGGITQGPTRALIGEAGPEAVIPLNDFSMKRAGFVPAEEEGRAQVINFYIENVYGIDDLAGLFYERVERGQAMGRIEPWTHTV